MDSLIPAIMFWNSNDPTLMDPFGDETLLPTMASCPMDMEVACGSTFLQFPSTTGTNSDSGGDSQEFLKTTTAPLSQQDPCSMIFDEIIASITPVAEEENEDDGEGASAPVSESSGGLHTTHPPPEVFYHPTSSWLPPAPPAHGYHDLPPREQARVHPDPSSGSRLCPADLFGQTLKSSTIISVALDSSLGSLRHHHWEPSPGQRSFRRPENAGVFKQQQQQQQQPQQLHAVKASRQSSPIFELPAKRGISLKESTGSPCGVISQVADQFVSSTDYPMEISSSIGPSTTYVAAAAQYYAVDEAAAAVKSVNHSHESRATTPGEAEGRAHSILMPGEAQESVAKPVTMTLTMTAKRKRSNQPKLSSEVESQVTAKRKKSNQPKLSSEVESQRVSHIAVERSCRKQMNDRMATLRALMRHSFFGMSDQASIVGGAVDFVKELEHLLHCLQTQGRPNPEPQLSQLQPPFAFHSLQRLVDPSPSLLGGSSTNINLGARTLASTRLGPQLGGSYPAPAQIISVPAASPSPTLLPWSLEHGGVVGEASSDMASVEVKLVPVPVPSPGFSPSTPSSSEGPTAALVKIMAAHGENQLLRMVETLERLALTVMHTNITTVGSTMLYSFHVHIGSLRWVNGNEMACAIHQTFVSLNAFQF